MSEEVRTAELRIADPHDLAKIYVEELMRHAENPEEAIRLCQRQVDAIQKNATPESISASFVEYAKLELSMRMRMLRDMNKLLTRTDVLALTDVLGQWIVVHVHEAKCWDDECSFTGEKIHISVKDGINREYRIVHLVRSVTTGCEGCPPSADRTFNEDATHMG